MNTRQRATRPPIDMIDTEAHAIAIIAADAEAAAPLASDMLLAEVERATLHDARSMPHDVVTMNTTVEFVDDADGADRTVKLVYPGDANLDAGRLSILTPVGAGLIGLRQGQSILWPDRDGRERTLTILRVAQPSRVA